MSFKLQDQHAWTDFIVVKEIKLMLSWFSLTKKKLQIVLHPICFLLQGWILAKLQLSIYCILMLSLRLWLLMFIFFLVLFARKSQIVPICSSCVMTNMYLRDLNKTFLPKYKEIKIDKMSGLYINNIWSSSDPLS